MRTLIVCYAESPAEFKANHPELSMRMEAAWEIYEESNSEGRAADIDKEESPEGSAKKLNVLNLLKNRSKGSFLDTLKGDDTMTGTVV